MPYENLRDTRIELTKFLANHVTPRIGMEGECSRSYGRRGTPQARRRGDNRNMPG